MKLSERLQNKLLNEKDLFLNKDEIKSLQEAEKALNIVSTKYNFTLRLVEIKGTYYYFPEFE